MQRRSSTVSATGTTTLPKAIRDALGLGGGGRIEWLLDQDGRLIVGVRHRYVGGTVIEVDAFGAKATCGTVA